MNRKNCKVGKLLCLLTGILLTSCALTDDGQVMDGYLIKKSRTTSYVKDQAVWLSDIKTADPSMASVLESVGRQEWSKSISEARQVLRNRPFHRLCFLVLATAYAGMNQWDKAYFYAERIIRSQPDHVAALNILGLYTLSDARLLEDYRRAATYFRKSFQKNPAEVASGLNLGYLYLDLGHHSNAEKVFSQVYRRCGGCSEGALGLAISMSRSGQASQAKNLLQKVVRKNPESMTAWYQLALIVRNEDKDYDKSSEYLKNILEHPGVSDSELLEKARVLWYANRSVKSL